MDQLTFDKVPVTGSRDVIEHITRTLIRPDISIGIGSGEMILALRQWFEENAKSQQCRNVSVYCTHSEDKEILIKTGMKAYHGIPEEQEENFRGKAWALDYYFEEIDKMNEHLYFVKTSLCCQIRKEFFFRSEYTVFFLCYKKGERFSSISDVPIEIHQNYLEPLKKTFKSGCTRMSVMSKADENDVVKTNLSMKPNALVGEQTLCEQVFRLLRELHGVVADGLYTNVRGVVVEIRQSDKTTSMTTSTIQNYPEN